MAMTIFKIVRNYCGNRINDRTDYDYTKKRNRYKWVCAKNRLRLCLESDCPMMKKIRKAEKK